MKVKIDRLENKIILLIIVSLLILTTTQSLASQNESDALVSIQTDKAQYEIGETVNVTVNVPDITNLRLYYEYQGFVQKYLGNYSEFSFVPRGTGTHYLVLRDLSNNEITRASFEIIEGKKSILPLENISQKNLSIRDSRGLFERVTIKAYDDTNNEINLSAFDKKNGQKRIERLEIESDRKVFKKLVLKKLSVDSADNFSLGIDEVPVEKAVFSGRKTISAFAVDASELNFTNGTLTRTAEGTELWKCKEWNFENQQCLGAWQKIMDLTPGQDYELEISPDDPGYAETSITIINVQSYPVVGGNWTVAFNTTGKADLFIRAVNGTTWSNEHESGYDLKLLEIRCGDQLVSFEWVNSTVVVRDYECNVTGTEASQVLTSDKHELEFDFGGVKAYAKNNAQSRTHQKTVGYFILSEDAEVNENVNIYSDVNFEIPETSPVIRNAWIEIELFNAHAVATTANVAVYLNNTLLDGQAVTIRNSGEAQRHRFLKNATAIYSITSSGNYTFPVNISLSGVNRTSITSARLYITYDYDLNSSVQQKTVRFFIANNPDNISIGLLIANNFTINLPENNVKVKSAWFMITGITDGGAGYATVQLNGTNLTQGRARVRGTGETQDFLIVANATSTTATLYNLTGNAPSASYTLGFYPISNDLTAYSSVADITYKYDANSATQLNTVEYFINSSNQSGVLAGTSSILTGNFTVYLPEGSPSVKSCGFEIGGFYDNNAVTPLIALAVNNTILTTGGGIEMQGATTSTDELSGFTLFVNGSSAGPTPCTINDSSTYNYNFLMNCTTEACYGQYAKLILTYSYDQPSTTRRLSTNTFFIGNSNPMTLNATTFNQNFSIRLPVIPSVKSAYMETSLQDENGVNNTYAVQLNSSNVTFGTNRVATTGLAFDMILVKNATSPAASLFDINTDNTDYNYLYGLQMLTEDTYRIGAKTALTFEYDIPYLNVNINTSLNNSQTQNNAPSIQFNFTSSSSLANCSLYFNSTAYNYTTGTNNNTQTTLTPNTTFSDGNYLAYIECADTYGLIGNSSVINITIDNGAPAVNPMNPANNNFSSSTQPSFIFNYTDSLSSTANCTLFIGASMYGTNSSTLNNTPTTITANASLVNGTYSWNVTCTDLAGNSNGSATRTITIDTGAPVLSAISPADGNWTKDNTTDFVFEVNDSFSSSMSCLVSVDGSDVGSNSSTMNNTQTTITSSTLVEGTHNWTINCSDDAGNEGFSAWRNLSIDITGPIATLDKPASDETISGISYEVNASVTDAGIDNISLVTFEYRINGTDTWEFVCSDDRGPDYACTWDLSGREDGQDYQLRAWANDTLGNIGAYDNHTNITIDTTAPAITNVLNDSITSSSARINWTTNEEANGSLNYGTTLSMADGSANHSDFVLQHNVTLSSLTNSTLYYYNITSCDAYGNCNTTGPYNLTTVASNTAPTIVNVSSVPAQIPVAESTIIVQVNFTASDIDGVGDLNDSTARAIFNNSGVTREGNCTPNDINATSTNYNCSVPMQYYDPAGLWFINVTVIDNSQVSAYNATTDFTYQELLYIQVSPVVFGFGDFYPGQVNQSAISNPLLIDNMGNVNLSQINITAYNLVNGSFTLGAGNITVNVSNAPGTALQNAVNVTVPYANVSVDSSGVDANESLYFYISAPNLPALNYSSSNDWVISAGN